MNYGIIFTLIVCVVMFYGCVVDVKNKQEVQEEVLELTEDTRVCEPGRTVSCACVGAEQGVQVCKDDGSGYEECICSDASQDTQIDDISEELDSEQDSETSEDIIEEPDCTEVDESCIPPMVTIPDSVFMMGCNFQVDNSCSGPENPYHEVNVPEFEVDTTEVTVAQYRVCVEDNNSCSEPSIESNLCNWRYSGREEHPVNCINWYQAKTFCEWSGKRLCTESEWETAARGTDGRIYPWGNEDSDCDRAVMENDHGAGCGEHGTWVVASKPSGIYGLYDMAGNIWELVEDDWHSHYDGAPDDGVAWIESPRVSRSVSRGGSFNDDTAKLRTSNRGYADLTYNAGALGTRCCRILCANDSDCNENHFCCNGTCADLRLSNRNCGECGHECLAGENYIDSVCRCGVLNGACRDGETCQNGLCFAGDIYFSPMVVIPEGAFMMGCNDSIDNNCDVYENPYHEVTVPEFKIDVTEVTVSQYRVCVEDNSSCSEPETNDVHCNWQYDDREEHPVNCINWQQAKEYCEWTGKKLCSESEWEKAARGTDGRIYPWGNEVATCNRTVMDDGGDGCGEDQTWPVASKPSGIYGLYDMAGNVYEWIEDDWRGTYDDAPDDGSARIDNPRTSDRSKRGGCFRHHAASQRASFRSYDDHGVSYDFTGIRCCSAP